LDKEVNKLVQCEFPPLCGIPNPVCQERGWVLAAIQKELRIDGLVDFDGPT
jgi:hypothetical protein